MNMLTVVDTFNKESVGQFFLLSRDVQVAVARKIQKAEGAPYFDALFEAVLSSKHPEVLQELVSYANEEFLTPERALAIIDKNNMEATRRLIAKKDIITAEIALAIITAEGADNGDMMYDLLENRSPDVMTPDVIDAVFEKGNLRGFLALARNENPEILTEDLARRLTEVAPDFVNMKRDPIMLSLENNNAYCALVQEAEENYKRLLDGLFIYTL